MKRNYVSIGAACLLCLALVTVVPAAALGGWENAGGQQATSQSGCTENPEGELCRGPAAWACQHGAAAGAGACNRTCDQVRNRTCQA